MSNNDRKTIISMCPFQTQLVLQLPMAKGKLIAGAIPSPQIIKVPCDRGKCQLWDGSEDVCAVSAIAGIEERLVDLTDILSCSLGDILDTMKGIKSILAPPLRTQ